MLIGVGEPMVGVFSCHLHQSLATNKAGTDSGIRRCNAVFPHRDHSFPFEIRRFKVNRTDDYLFV